MSRKKLCLLLIVLVISTVAVLIGTRTICLFHEWLPATCTAEEHCKYCDARQGAPLGHTWIDATCEHPKTCRICNEVEGAAMGHKWAEATCDQPKACDNCNAVEGDALGHDPGPTKRTSTDTDIIEGYYTTVKSCKRCEKVVETTTFKYLGFISNDRFIFTPSQYMARVNNAVSSISGFHGSAGTKMVDGKLWGVVWDVNGEAIFALRFFGTGEDEEVHDRNAKNVRGFTGFVYDLDYLSHIAVAIPLASDPDLSFDDAKTIGKEILNAYFNGGVYTYNGIRYGIVGLGNTVALGITVDE